MQAGQVQVDCHGGSGVHAEPVVAIERRIQAQLCHDCHGFRQALTGGRQGQGCIGTIRRHDQWAFGQPGPHLRDHLARPIGEQIAEHWS